MSEFNLLALEGVLWLGVTALIIYGPWQRVCVDYARDIIFEQRDRIFDVAASGALQFGDVSYEKVRAHMNAMIRMAHCVTAPRVVFLVMYAAHIHDPARRNDIWDCIKQIQNEETRAIVMDAVTRAETAVVRLMVARSPFLLLVHGLAKISGKISQLRRMISGAVMETLEKAIAYEAS
jgi:hypothetical protein